MMAQKHNLAWRATSDEIRKQPEYQYVTSWAAPRPENRRSKLGLQRPHTATVECPGITTRPRAFSDDRLCTTTPMRSANMSFEKGILRLRPSTVDPRREYQLRRYSMGSLPEESVYKNIAHLFQADAFSGKALQICSSSRDVGISTRRQSYYKKKAIRFADVDNEVTENNDDDSSGHIQVGVEIRINNEVFQQSDEKTGSPLFEKDNSNLRTTYEKTESEISLEPENGRASPFNYLSANGSSLGCKENVESNEESGNKGEICLKETKPSDMECTSRCSYPDLCPGFSELSIERKPRGDSNDEIVQDWKDNDIQEGKLNTRRMKHQKEKLMERSCYDADLEKCDKYLRAQSHSFTQTSQYMSNTKRGLSRLSMHYSQTNTAYNDRVIMSDLLKNGHTRNALIGDSVYSVERRLYNRRRDPMKSTTFYDRFVSQRRSSRSKHPQSTRKRKSRTVADRAKERQERINKKKEELERGFPPRAWSLVEVGEEEIKHMLDTCRYLRVDIRKQPNVYGIVDLSK